MQSLSPSFCLKVSSGFSPFFSIPVCLFGGCPGSSLLRNIIPLFFSVIENFYIIYFLPLYYIIVTYIAILYLFLSFFSCFEQLCNLLFVYFSIFPPFFVFTYSLFTRILGITINELKQSAIFHTKSTCASEPNNTQSETRTAYGFTAFFPNKYFTLACPKKYHPIIVENAKKNIQIAINTLHIWGCCLLQA